MCPGALAVVAGRARDSNERANADEKLRQRRDESAQTILHGATDESLVQGH